MRVCMSRVHTILLHIGESCTGDRGSSELVSPLKAFLLCTRSSTLLLSPEFRRRAMARCSAKMWKFDPDEQSVDDAKNAFLWQASSEHLRTLLFRTILVHIEDNCMRTCAWLCSKCKWLLVQAYTKCLFVRYKMSLKLRSLWVHGCLSFIHSRVHHIVLLNIHLHSYSILWSTTISHVTTMMHMWVGWFLWTRLSFSFCSFLSRLCAIRVTVRVCTGDTRRSAKSTRHCQVQSTASCPSSRSSQIFWGCQKVNSLLLFAEVLVRVRFFDDSKKLTRHCKVQCVACRRQ